MLLSRIYACSRERRKGFEFEEVGLRERIGGLNLEVKRRDFGGCGGGGESAGGVAMSYALMTIIQRVLWLCSDKKSLFYAFDVSKSKSGMSVWMCEKRERSITIEQLLLFSLYHFLCSFFCSVRLFQKQSLRWSQKGASAFSTAKTRKPKRATMKKKINHSSSSL